MRILSLFLIISILSNCSTVEVAKEVTKATYSIKTSVTNILKNSNSDQEEKSSDTNSIDQEIMILEKEKKKKKESINNQKIGTKINFLNKTLKEIELMIGEFDLIRIDGNSKTVRYDNKYCQLYLFLESIKKNAQVKYFEIRNREGKLIIKKEKIKKCYNNFKLI